jgi:hypothetical protein
LVLLLAAVLGPAMAAGADGDGEKDRDQGQKGERKTIALPSQAEAAELCQPGTTIDEVIVETVNVFDPRQPGESAWFFRAVNAVHRPMLTKENTVVSLLTVNTGDPCSMEELEEAARVLRRYDFIQDAWVVPIRREGDRVTVLARVQDAWSTSVGISFSSEGGSSTSAFELQEVNLLGTGTELTFEYNDELDRTERVFKYADPSLFGSRWQGALEYADNTDGQAELVQVLRPFYKLSTRWAFDVGYRGDLRNEKVYSCLRDGAVVYPCFAPDEIALWELDYLDVWTRVGYAIRPYRNKRLLRLWAGLRQNEEAWLDARELNPSRRRDLRPLDYDHTLLTLTAAFRAIDFRKIRYLNSARRVEDFDLGDGINLSLAAAVPGISGDSGGGIGLLYRKGLDMGDRGFAIFETGYSVQRIGSEWYRSLLDVEGTWYYKPAPLQSVVVRALVSHGRHLDGPHQFLLGGDAGARAYETRTFVGNNRLVLVGEHRFFAPWYVGKLARMGLVGFAEVAGAWEDELAWDQIHPGIGVGLRAELVRTSGGTTLHLNVAWPLDPNAGDEQEVRISVLSATGF